MKEAAQRQEEPASLANRAAAEARLHAARTARAHTPRGARRAARAKRRQTAPHGRELIPHRQVAAIASLTLMRLFGHSLPRSTAARANGTRAAAQTSASSIAAANGVLRRVICAGAAAYRLYWCNSMPMGRRLLAQGLRVFSRASDDGGSR